MPDTDQRMTPDNLRPISIARIVNSEIVSANQLRIGHVVDVEVSRSQGYRITALLFGEYGWLYRLRVPRRALEQLGVSVKPRRIPWCGIAQIEPGRVILRHRLVAKR